MQNMSKTGEKKQYIATSSPTLLKEKIYITL